MSDDLEDEPQYPVGGPFDFSIELLGRGGTRLSAQVSSGNDDGDAGWTPIAAEATERGSPPPIADGLGPTIRWRPTISPPPPLDRHSPSRAPDSSPPPTPPAG